MQSPNRTSPSPDDSSPDSSHDAPEAGSAPSPSSPRRRPPARHGRRAAIAAGVGGIIIGIIQSYAAETDYQYAFFATLAVSAITLLSVFYQLQRWALAHHFPWLVPVASVGVVAVVVTLFRIETLSGDLIPQITWRFATKDVPAPETAPAEQPAASAVPTEPVRWGGFLGNRRDGVVPQREFAIPGSPDQVHPKWRIGVGGGWASFAVAGDVAVTLEQREDRECVTAYRLSDGELLWLVDHEALHDNPLGGQGPRSTPSIAEGRVFAQGATGKLWCLDLATGEEIWSRDLLMLGEWAATPSQSQAASETLILWGRAGSPLLVDDLCVIPFGSPEGKRERSLIAFEAATGQIRWRAGDDQISYASPQWMTFDGVRQIVSVNEATITGHTIETGQTLWSFDWVGQSNTGANCASAIFAGEDRFLIGKGYGRGSALVEVRRDEVGQWTAEPVWQSHRVLKTKFNHAVVRDGVAYALSNGALQAVEVDTGRRLWEQSRRGRFGQGQVILAGDTLVVQAEEGEVALVEATPEAYRELVRIPALQHKTWNIPTLVGDTLLVRNAQEAIALQLPPRGEPSVAHEADMAANGGTR